MTFEVRRHWWNRRRNWLNETTKGEQKRRIIALEEHIESLEERYSELENRLNVHAQHLLEVKVQQDNKPAWSNLVDKQPVKVQLPTLRTGSQTDDN